MAAGVSDGLVQRPERLRCPRLSRGGAAAGTVAENLRLSGRLLPGGRAFRVGVPGRHVAPVPARVCPRQWPFACVFDQVRRMSRQVLWSDPGRSAVSVRSSQTRVRLGPSAGSRGAAPSSPSLSGRHWRLRGCPRGGLHARERGAACGCHATAPSWLTASDQLSSYRHRECHTQVKAMLAGKLCPKVNGLPCATRVYARQVPAAHWVSGRPLTPQCRSHVCGNRLFLSSLSTALP